MNQNRGVLARLTIEKEGKTRKKKKSVAQFPRTIPNVFTSDFAFIVFRRLRPANEDGQLKLKINKIAARTSRSRFRLSQCFRGTGEIFISSRPPWRENTRWLRSLLSRLHVWLCNDTRRCSIMTNSLNTRGNVTQFLRPRAASEHNSRG